MYSGTVSDFSGSDALIYRGNLRTEQYDLKHLNGKIKYCIRLYIPYKLLLQYLISYNGLVKYKIGFNHSHESRISASHLYHPVM